ncbi:MAG: ABC transporter permease [Thermoplasmata archaeon]
MVRRTIAVVLTLLVVLVFNFFLFRLPTFIYGTDPADLILNPDFTEEQQEALRGQYGIPPSNATFMDWTNYFFKTIYSTLTFQFGYSFVSFKPVIQEIEVRLPNTLILLGVATILAIIIGIWVGIIGGRDVGKKKDVAMVVTSLSVYSTPIFWLGLIFILIFSFYLAIFPVTGGTTSYPIPEGLLPKIVDYAWHLSLPAATLTISGFGSWFLLMRNSIVNVFTEDYIVTARAKGLDERTVLYKHALRNALLPTVTVIALSIASLWTGAILTETVFSWYGMGRYFLQSILMQDWPAAEALFYLVALTVVMANFVADVVYGFLDPRIRYD